MTKKQAIKAYCEVRDVAIAAHSRAKECEEDKRKAAEALLEIHGWKRVPVNAWRINRRERKEMRSDEKYNIERAKRSLIELDEAHEVMWTHDEYVEPRGATLPFDVALHVLANITLLYDEE